LRLKTKIRKNEQKVKRKKKEKSKKSLPVHVKPSPEYPVLQAQLKLPTVFVHNAFDAHPPLFVEHSFTSLVFLKKIELKTKSIRSKKKRKILPLQETPFPV